MKFLYFLSLFLFLNFSTYNVASPTWGFMGHRYITDHAIFALPISMLGFYKTNRDYLLEQCLVPDKRKHADPEEPPRHYIDIELFQESQIDSIPKFWQKAVEKYTQDSLQSFGILPWHCMKMKYFLTKAFETKDYENILRLSAELSHYIADAHVPLHTTENYNGQLTGQKGIHALWETRTLEKYIDSYSITPYQARYIPDAQNLTWSFIKESHVLVSEVLALEKQLTQELKDKKYQISKKGKQRVKTYSDDFVDSYHKGLNNQIQERYISSIYRVADFWYSCWVDAGRPKLPKKRIF